MALVGFIGLGRMGAPMAANLLRAGHTLSVYARRPDAAAALIRDGATLCASPGAVAAGSDVIFVMVTNTEAVEEVLLGHDGVISSAVAGAVVIDHSTIAPAASQRIAAALKARGVEMLDAPVSGGIAGATAGTLSIMVGGDADVFERCRPLLESLGKTIVHVGGPGLGQVAKACNQICILANQLGVAEAVLLARHSGLDFATVKEALMGGFAASRVLEMQGPKMAAEQFEGQIESRLHHKDLLIALEWAAQLGLALPTSMLAAELLGDLQRAGGGTLDSAAVITSLERRATQPPT